MKFYNPDKLFIAKVGYTRFIYKHGKEYDRFIESGVAIVKQKYEYEYSDVITNQRYKLFGNFCCVTGDNAILLPKSFTLFIRECYEYTQEFEIINRIAKKVLKGKKVSELDIKDLNYYLNKSLNNNKKDDINIENSFDANNLKNSNAINSENEKENANYITILTNKKFKYEPAIGRDNELKELIITLAQDKKNPILVGPSGTGKTTIVDQLAYKIQKNSVPNFLKNKKIIELDMTNLIAGTKYVGTLEEKINKLIDYAIENDAIVFIDEIHTIYGAGSTEKNNNDVASMIKQAIDRKGLKVIGTTTKEEYDKFFSNDALKRRFEKVLVEEPNDKLLYQIIDKVFTDYSKNNNIELLDNMNNIISVLIELTHSKHRSWNDEVCNPDLVLGIIDRIFADAKVNNQDKLTIYNIIYGISSCNRIYDICKETAISNLDLKENTTQKIIQLKKKN